MRHCFYHTDLGQQNAVFDSFAIQIAVIQYSGGVDKTRNMEHSGTFRNMKK